VVDGTVSIVVVLVRRVVAEVGLDDIEPAVFVVVGYGNAHPGLLLPVIVQRRAGGNAGLLEGPVLLIVIQQAGLRVARDVQVRIAVIIQIRSDRGEAVTSGGLADPTRYRYVFEFATALVAEQKITAGRQPARTAHHRHPLPLTVTAGSRLGNLRSIELDISGDDQIEFAVQVVIEEGTSGIPANRLRAQPRL